MILQALGPPLRVGCCYGISKLLSIGSLVQIWTLRSSFMLQLPLVHKNFYQEVSQNPILIDHLDKWFTTIVMYWNHHYEALLTTRHHWFNKPDFPKRNQALLTRDSPPLSFTKAFLSGPYFLCGWEGVRTIGFPCLEADPENQCMVNFYTLVLVLWVMHLQKVPIFCFSWPDHLHKRLQTFGRRPGCGQAGKDHQVISGKSVGYKS